MSGASHELLILDEDGREAFTTWLAVGTGLDRDRCEQRANNRCQRQGVGVVALSLRSGTTGGSHVAALWRVDRNATDSIRLNWHERDVGQ